MFLLETDVVSERLHPFPDPIVETWVGDRLATAPYISTIARSRGMAVVTRNVRDFEDTGIEVVDPWTAA